MGSAVDTLTAGSGATTPPAATKRNAVAHETAVDVTGARPGLDSGKRELFAESTTSVLVFENGGVIRLAADVAVGQLLFLTHASTKREVVAQVTRKHALGSGYVEVEFTEPAPGFWDVAFPSEPQPAQTRRVEPAPAAALREAVERADQEAPAAPNAPNLAEVERLKSEVEALREQLESIKRQPPQPEASLPAPPWVVKKAKEEALEAAEQAQIAGQLANAQESAAVAEASAAEIAVARHGFAAQDLLPKAALDFSRADALDSAPRRSTTSVQSVKFQDLVPGRSSAGKLPLLLFAALLLATLGAAWYQGWIRGLPHGKTQPTVAAAPPRPAPAKPAVAGNAQKPATPLASQAGATGTKSLTSESTASAPNASAGDVPPESAAKDSQAESNSEESPVAASPAKEKPAPLASGISARPAKTASASEIATKKTIDADVAPVSENEEGIVPPKLVHSVRAVPPPEAARNFATGNVILDAIVDASGHVQSSRVLSGPASLRSAAVSAVKQYEYRPAKKRGKTVPAHVQVTVQFWYEP